jgi:hypothetical protein
MSPKWWWMPASSRRALARRRRARRLGVFEASGTPPACDLGGVRRRQDLGDMAYASASTSARSRRFSATSSCQNSLALVVSTSNSNRSTISGTMSALST